MKQNLVISCPASSRSGYGDHTRDILRSLIAMDRFNIQIKDQRWGNCPMDALTEADLDIHNLIVPGPPPTKPDIWMQITVPNEFQPLGKYNIGITAGIETTLCSAKFVEGLNRMDWVIVPSNFSKDVFVNTKFDKMDKNKVKIDELRCTTKIDVLFEGLDTEIFNKTNDIPATIVKNMDEVENNFCYLFVGHWMHGSFGHDRKDIGATIRTFIEAFKEKSKKNMPALILKTSSATFSVTDREQILDKIRKISNSTRSKDIPNIYLLHGDLTPAEMNGLYNHPKVKAMVSFTHGEGFGRPLLEFSMTGKPTICSDWSGHLDFIKKYGVLLGGELKQIDKSSIIKDMLIPEASWFFVNYGNAITILKDVHKNYKKYFEKSRKQTQYIKDNWTLEKMTTDFQKMVDENVPNFEIKIPTLEEI